jgi:hypothetical protein
MKARKKIRNGKSPRRWISVLGACAAVGTVSAADTNAPAPLTPQQFFEGGDKSYDNWVDFSFGGFMNNGNRSQLQQAQQSSFAAFGGLEDLHYQKDVAKDTTLSLDGRALFDNHDYKFKLGLERDKLGFLNFSFDEFRTWSDGDGGYYPPTGTFYPLSNEALALDRGQLSFEGGLRLQNDKVPDVTFKYTHGFRDGGQNSTIWGPSDTAIGVTQGLSPSSYDIHERSDSFQLDATQQIKTTDVGVGFRYETGQLDDALKIDQYPGEPIEQKITDQQNSTYDMLSAHAFTETWLKKNLMFSTGFSYSDLDNNLSGSRIYGSDFGVGYVPNILSGASYYNLGGDTRLHEYVTELNLLYKPTASFSVIPSLRVQKEDTDANLSGTETFSTDAPVPFSAYSQDGDLDVRERLDLTYNGLTNWVFYARGDLAEGNGNLSVDGGLVPIGFFNVPNIQQQTDDERFFQKYSAGVRWYPLRSVTLDAGGYFKDDKYNYSDNIDSTPNNAGPGNDLYPGFILVQSFRTWDGNLRLALRPWRNVMLTSRYEYQLSAIQTEPDPASGLPGVESSRMTSHIIAEDISWSPWSRLYLQAGINYVLSRTATPASDATAAILNAQNNYWMLNLSSGFVMDDKTDLNLGYFYYRANDYENISTAGVPYGAGAQEQGITATIVRRLTKNIRASLKYGCFHGLDQPSGGNNNYLTQFVYTSLQYRF